MSQNKNEDCPTIRALSAYMACRIDQDPDMESIPLHDSRNPSPDGRAEGFGEDGCLLNDSPPTGISKDMEFIQEFTLKDKLAASCFEGAHRLGRLTFYKLHKVKNALLSDDGPIDDGWDVIDKEEAIPPQHSEKPFVETSHSTFVNADKRGRSRTSKRVAMDYEPLVGGAQSTAQQADRGRRVNKQQRGHQNRSITQQGANPTHPSKTPYQFAARSNDPFTPPNTHPSHARLDDQPDRPRRRDRPDAPRMDFSAATNFDPEVTHAHPSPRTKQPQQFSNPLCQSKGLSPVNTSMPPSPYVEDDTSVAAVAGLAPLADKLAKSED